MHWIVLAILFGFLTTGCAGSIIGTQEWFENHSFGKSNLQERASFDMSCDKDQLSYQKLGNNYTQVGVLGCGKKASYVLDETIGDWILNSEIQKQ